MGNQTKHIHQVLVVDDNVDIRLLLKKRLETEGYKVITAENGLEATKSLLTNSPCLIILDLMMPIMDGWQFLEWKKEQNSEIVNLPVIVVSAVSSNTKAPDGVKNFLKKPVSITQMLDCIQACC